MLYTAVKHSHILFAVLSVLFFNFRFWVYFSKERPKFIRISPHIIDTIFLITGIILIFQTGYFPFKTGGGWLTVKLGMLIGYIFFGIWAMRQKYVPTKRITGYMLANIAVIVMLYLALYKPFIF